MDLVMQSFSGCVTAENFLKALKKEQLNIVLTTYLMLDST